MQSTYLTPAEKEITIYISYNTFGIWTCTVSCREAVYNTSVLQVAHYTETRIVSQQFDLMQSHVWWIYQDQTNQISRAWYFLFKKIKSKLHIKDTKHI